MPFLSARSSSAARFVSTAAQNQLSIIVVLEGFANLGLVRIEVERLARDLADILSI